MSLFGRKNFRNMKRKILLLHLIAPLLYLMIWGIIKLLVPSFNGGYYLIGLLIGSVVRYFRNQSLYLHSASFKDGKLALSLSNARLDPSEELFDISQLWELDVKNNPASLNFNTVENCYSFIIIDREVKLSVLEMLKDKCVQDRLA